MKIHQGRSLATCLLAIWISSALAFAPRNSARTQCHPSIKSRTSRLQVLPDLMSSGDVSFALGHAQDLLASTSTLLADAAGATAEAAKEEGGWWQSYLQIFKNILVFVHDTVDKPLGKIGIENTWGISIAIFTASMRSLLVPLSIQQNKNSEYMKALKPYMNDIKEKFKDNEQAKNRAMGKLLEDANQNPLAGCFVSLAQLPILLGLYRGIRLLAMDGQLQESFLWIPSLEGPVSPPDYRGTEWLTSGWTTDAITGYPVPQMGWETTLAFLAMPALLVVLQSLTLNILQPPMDESASEEELKTQETTQIVFKFLPLMIGFFALQVPAGLTIYWVTTNLYTLFQSLAVRAYFAANPPDIKLPEYWDTLNSQKDVAEMTPDEKRAAMKAGLRVGPTMEELMDESKFYAFVERGPMRSQSAAWERASAQSINVPPQLEAWVKAGGNAEEKPSHSTDTSVNTTAEPFYATRET